MRRRSPNTAVVEDVITEDECHHLVLTCDRLHAEAGEPEDPPAAEPLALPDGSATLPRVPRDAGLRYRFGEAGFVVRGFGGNYSYALTALCDAESREIVRRVGARLERLTGIGGWGYGQNVAMAPVNRYDMGGGYIQPHRDGDIFGFGEFRTVATIAISSSGGGALFVNAGVSTDGMRVADRDSEDVSTREVGEIPVRSAVLFDNHGVIHGTTPVSEPGKRRFVLTLRSTDALPLATAPCCCCSL
jgi:hypothetical protein